MQNTICSCVFFFVTAVSSHSFLRSHQSRPSPRLNLPVPCIHRSSRSFLVIWDQVILGRHIGEVGMWAGSSHTVYARHNAVAAARDVHTIPSSVWDRVAPRVCDPLSPLWLGACQLNKFSNVCSSFCSVSVSCCLGT